MDIPSIDPAVTNQAIDTPASLAQAAGEAKALQANIALLQSESDAADSNVGAAAQAAGEAQSAFASGNLDALSAVNLKTTAADR